MEWQSKLNTGKVFSSQRLYSKKPIQTKKDSRNYQKPYNTSKVQKYSSNVSFIKSIQTYSHQKSPSMTSRSQTIHVFNSIGTSTANLAVKPQNHPENEQSKEMNKFYEMCNYYSSKQSSYALKGTSQFGATISYSGEGKAFTISELNGFKIVQNGTIIHDETFDESIEATYKPKFIPFTLEDRFKPHSESSLTFTPRSKLIPLPTFMESEE